MLYGAPGFDDARDRMPIGRFALRCCKNALTRGLGAASSLDRLHSDRQRRRDRRPGFSYDIW